MMGGGIGVELPWLRWIGGKLPFQICQDLWAGNEYLERYAQQAVDGMKASTNGEKNIFANMMAEAEKGEKLDDGDVRNEALMLIVAGTDTTSITLTYLVWAVLCRPELQRRLVREVQTLPDSFQDSDVERLPLLSAVIDESLRLYGAAPGGLPRIVRSGGTTLGGYYSIPGGTTLTTQAYTYHRDPALFPDAAE